MTAKEKWKRLEKLLANRKDLNLAPQTVAREYEAAQLDIEITLLECEVKAAVSKRARIFLDAWIKAGRFTAIREDGARMEAAPVVTGVPVQDFWNAKGEAYRLANWSLGTIRGAV